ncbi:MULTISPECIES: DUF2931 family protein [unclassified Pseudomonas]|uniref:DUF2931 family protein n=1 Tax=unclassified Pseudomonas TaxID=196821 RepID=UPI000A1EC14A|nr:MULTISPECIES: DUF2931 family protein [unclassified Pseudomonas]
MLERSSSPLKICVLLLSILLTGCSSVKARKLPYDAWSLNFYSPDYMDVWIETAAVLDIDGKVFGNAGSGIPAQGYPRPLSKGVPAEFRGKPAGWPEIPGGKGRRVVGANLPELLYVRWQSIAEPQTYNALIRIPESTRELMRNSEDVFCRAYQKVATRHRKWLVVGLAPGGIVKVWITGPCLQAIEVTREQASVVPLGPHLGKALGEYYFFQEESKAYVEKFGIPYGSW